MEEKHTCQCSSKANEENLKKLEIMAKGSFSERTMKTMFIGLIVFCCILIISVSIVAGYGINRYHNYIMNNETVERVEVVEEIIGDDYYRNNNNAAGSIINNTNSNIDNSIIGADNGSIKQHNKN